MPHMMKIKKQFHPSISSLLNHQARRLINDRTDGTMVFDVTCASADVLSNVVFNDFVQIFSFDRVSLEHVHQQRETHEKAWRAISTLKRKMLQKCLLLRRQLFR